MSAASMCAMQTIRILLVDDHAIVREGYRALLAKQPGMQVVADASNAWQAYQLFKDCSPNLVITDLSLPDASGLELIARIKQRQQDVKILVFSMHHHSGFVEQAMRAGASGYVSKSSSAEELLFAISEVYLGRQALSSDIARVLAFERLGSERNALETLTVREFEIFRLLVGGRGNDEIAKMLSISPKTLANCHYLIKRKLGVTSDIALTRLAVKLKLLD